MNMKKKILIAYASYGSGHKTAAQYVYDYFNKFDKYELKIIDLMDYGNKIGKLSTDLFNLTFKYSQKSLFTLVYNFFNHRVVSSHIPYKTITKAILKNKELRRDIEEFKPDLLISPHFFPSIILGIFNSKGYTNTKIITIVTDFETHQLWTVNEKNEDAIVVSNDIMKKELIKKGIDKNKIYPYGIPLSSKFKEVDDKVNVKNKYHVNNDLKTFLFFAGGSMGSSNSYQFFKKLLKERFDINIIYVCGKNEELKVKAEKLVLNEKYKNVTVLGFSNDINNLLNISDVVITKPGGLSITEALEMKKPLLLIPGNGGQEDYNERFIVKNGFGLTCKTPNSLVKNVTKLLTRPSILDVMIKKLNKYEKNTSVEKLYKLSNKLLKK